MFLPFQNCWDRVERAEFHRQSLIHIWDGLKTEDLYTSDPKIDHNGTGKFFVRAIQRDWLLPFSLHFGEMLYHLRAGLDSCVYDAAVLMLGTNPPPNPQQWNFPFCSSSAEFKESARRIKKLPDELRSLLEAVQPYTGAFGRTEDLEWDLGGTLFTLNDWARIDRHRRLNLVGTAITTGQIKFIIPPETGMSVEYCRINTAGTWLLEHNSEVAVFKIRYFVPGTNIGVYAELGIEVVVDEAPRMRMQDAALAMGLSVSAVRENFERYFGIKR